MHYMNRNLSARLSRVGVEQHLALPANGSDCLQRLKHSGLVISRHDANEKRFRPDRPVQLIQIEQAIRSNRYQGDGNSQPFQMMQRIEDGFMFRYHAHNVVAVRAASFENPFQGKIVGFRSATGEHNFTRICARKPRHLCAGLPYGLFGFPSITVSPASCVAEFRAEIGQHGIQHARIDRRRSVMIEIYWLIHGS